MTRVFRNARRLMRATAVAGLAVGAMLAINPASASAAPTTMCSPWATHQSWASQLWVSTCISKDGAWSLASVHVSNTGIIPIDVRKLTIYNTASGLDITAGTRVCGQTWVHPTQSYSCSTSWRLDATPNQWDTGLSSVTAYQPSGVGTTHTFASPFM